MMNDEHKDKDAKYGEFRLEYLSMIEPYLYVSKEVAAYALTLASISYSETLSERLTKYMVSVASNGFDKFSKTQMMFDIDNLDRADRLFWSREPCVELKAHIDANTKDYTDRGLFADENITRNAWQTHGHCISPLYRVVDMPIEDIVKNASMFMSEPRPSEEAIYQCILKMLTREIDTHYYKRNGKIAQIEKHVYDSKLGKYVTKTVNATKKMRVMKLAVARTVPGMQPDSAAEDNVYNRTRKSNRSDVIDILEPGETYFETLQEEREYKMCHLRDTRFRQNTRPFFGRRGEQENDENANGGLGLPHKSVTHESRLRLMILTSFLQQPADKILHCMKGWGYNGMQPMTIVCGDHEPMYPGILRVRTLESYDEEYSETCMANSDFITSTQAAFMSYDGTKKGMFERLATGRSRVTQTLNFAEIEENTFFARVMSMYGKIDYGKLPDYIKLANNEEYEIHYYKILKQKPELFGDLPHKDYPNDFFTEMRQADHIAKAHMNGEISIENSSLHVTDCFSPETMKIFAGGEDTFMEMEKVARRTAEEGVRKLLRVNKKEDAKTRSDYVRRLHQTDVIIGMYEERKDFSCQQLIAMDYINKGVPPEVAMSQAVHYIREQEAKFPGSLTIKHRHYAIVNQSISEENDDGVPIMYTHPAAIEIDSIDEELVDAEVIKRISVPYIETNMQQVYNQNAKKIVATDEPADKDDFFLDMDSENFLFSNEPASQNTGSESVSCNSTAKDKSLSKRNPNPLFSDDESDPVSMQGCEDEKSPSAYASSSFKSKQLLLVEDNSVDSVPGEFVAPYAVGAGDTSSDSEAVHRTLYDKGEINQGVNMMEDVQSSRRHTTSSSQKSYTRKMK
jgi:hypothetical protein